MDHIEDNPQPVVIHTKIPMDKCERSAFVPEVILNGQEDREVFLKTLVDTLVASLFAIDIAPYVIVTIADKIQKNNGDGVERKGKLVTVTLMVGRKPLVTTPNGSTANDSTKEMITIGNN